MMPQSTQSLANMRMEALDGRVKEGCFLCLPQDYLIILELQGAPERVHVVLWMWCGGRSETQDS